MSERAASEGDAGARNSLVLRETSDPPLAVERPAGASGSDARNSLVLRETSDDSFAVERPAGTSGSGARNSLVSASDSREREVSDERSAHAQGRSRFFRDPKRAGTIYESVSPEEFDSWAWQVRSRIDNREMLSHVYSLSPEEEAGFISTANLFRFATTPYYALLADRTDPTCPIRRQIVPRIEESEYSVGELADPLGEERLEVVPNLVHRYPDRALLLATDRCPVYCRFCTRRRIVGRIERQATRNVLEEAFEYIREHTELREVIISGGDALMLGDNQLEYMLRELRAVPHLDIIRIATRMPVTCPMRVTTELVEIVKRFSPIYVMTHFNHPREVTDSAARACARFVDAGIPVHNQSVLLRGVNDSAAVIAELNRLLVFLRVTPYYLHQCDMAEGIEHFRTPLAVGVSIIDALRGHMSGLAVPKLCVDVPGGHGKVTVQPDWIVKREGRSTTFRTYTGEMAEYLDPRE